MRSLGGGLGAALARAVLALGDAIAHGRNPTGKLRYTAGINIVFDASVRLKLSAELYDFTDFDDEVVANAGVVAAF